MFAFHFAPKRKMRFRFGSTYSTHAVTLAFPRRLYELTAFEAASQIQSSTLFSPLPESCILILCSDPTRLSLCEWVWQQCTHLHVVHDGLEGVGTVPVESNPCNFLIWMHVVLLPNRTRSGDQQQGLPWRFLPAPVRLKSGMLSWQVALVAHSCSCCATTSVSSRSLNSRPGRGDGLLLLGVSLTLPHSHISLKAQDRPA